MNQRNSSQYIQKIIDEKKYLQKNKNLDDNELYDLLTKKIKNLPKNKIDIITIVGGVASGKTTLAGKLIELFPYSDAISTDAFAAGTKEYRHTQYGNIENKYDIDLFNKKIEDLKNIQIDEYVKFPTYDAKTGLAATTGEKILERK